MTFYCKLLQLCPVAVSEDGNDGPILFDAVDVHVGRSDHEVNVGLADVHAVIKQVFIGHLGSSGKIERVRSAKSKVIRSIFVKQSVEEDDA